MENAPLLFIDTVSDLKDSENSNHSFFDSRIKSRKEVAKHRIKDIEAMLFYIINVLAEVSSNNKF